MDCPFHSKTPYLQSYKALTGADNPLYSQAKAISSRVEVTLEVPVAISYLESLLALPVPGDGFALEEGTAMFLVDGEVIQLVELRHQIPGAAEPW